MNAIGNILLISRLVAVLFMAVVLGLACAPGEAEKSGEAGGDLLDITREVGIDFVHDAGENGSYFIPEQIGSGCAFFDYDNDGVQDIYLINARTHDGSQPPAAWSQNQLYRQKSDGTFVNVTEESGLGDTGFGMGSAVGDFDNDGDLDVYVTNYGADQLYQNLGNGTFLNVTKAAGIKNESWGCSVTFVDYDLDGFLDIFVANYLRIDSTVTCTDRSGRPEYCGPEFQPAAADVLYKNNRDGTFTDVSFSSRIGLPERRGLGVVACDYNFDGYPDIYVANDGDENTLWTNRRDGTFTDNALPLGVAINRLGAREAGMGIAVGDITGKLTPDILVTNLDGEGNTLYFNHGFLGFEDASEAAGFERMDMLVHTGFGVGLVDLDLDANLDLVIGNGRVKRRPGVYTHGDSFWQDYSEPNVIFEGLGGGKFQNVSSRYPQFSGPVETSRGVAFADYDNDGDIDFLVTNCGGRARLYKNELARKGNWLSLTMFDPKRNRVVNGTRVILTAGNKKLAGEVVPGYSYLCSNDYRIHFGLGQLDAIDKATVHWLGGDVEEFAGIPINQHVKLEKGKGRAVVK